MRHVSNRPVAFVILLLCSAALLQGCPPPPEQKANLYVCVSALLPYEFHTLTISPASSPSSTNQTDSYHLTEGAVLKVAGLLHGEDYTLTMIVSKPGAASTFVTDVTGVISEDVFWLIYADASGTIRTTIHGAMPRTLQP